MTGDLRYVQSGWKAVVAVLAAVLALVVWRGAGAVGELRAAMRYEGEPSPSTSTKRPLRGASARSLEPGGGVVDLGSLDRGLLIVFDPGCAPSAANAWNWVDLVAELEPRGVRILAVSLEGADGAGRYWSGLRHHLEVVAVDSATMRGRLGVDATPATLLVEDGAVRRVYAGPLNVMAKQDVAARLGRGAGTDGK